VAVAESTDELCDDNAAAAATDELCDDNAAAADASTHSTFATATQLSNLPPFTSSSLHYYSTGIHFTTIKRLCAT